MGLWGRQDCKVVLLEFFSWDEFIAFRVAGEDAHSPLYVADEGDGSRDAPLVGAVCLVEGNLIIVAVLSDAHQGDEYPVGFLDFLASDCFFDRCAGGIAG